jgi:hypothetical protein
MNTGADFIKKLRPLGCALVLICFVGFLAVCFAPGEELLADYTPPKSGDYYAAHPQELSDELNENVLPLLPGSAVASVVDGVVVVTVQSESFFDVRSALLEHFDESLLTFERAG